MNRKEFREEQDRAEARKVLECVAAAIGLFVVPIVVMHNTGAGMGASILAGVVVTGAAIFAIEKAI